MIGNIPRVNNPLTVIAIFAGLSEIAMTVSLGLLEGNAQFIFMWFAGGFPTAIALGFFLVLIFRPALLYAPSDWQNEDYAFKLIQERNAARYEQVEEIYEKLNDLVESKLTAIGESSASIEDLDEVKADAQDVRRLITELRQSYQVEANQVKHSAKAIQPGERMAWHDSYSASAVMKAIMKLGKCSTDEIIETIQSNDPDASPHAIQHRLCSLIDLQFVKVHEHESGKASLRQYSAKSCDDAPKDFSEYP